MMGRDAKRTTFLDKKLRDKIRLSHPNLRDFYRAYGLGAVMPTDAFYRVMRGDACTPEERDLIQSRWVFNHAANFSLKQIKDSLNAANKHLCDTTEKKIEVADFIRDVIIYHENGDI